MSCNKPSSPCYSWALPTRETSTARVIVNSFSRSIQTKSTLKRVRNPRRAAKENRFTKIIPTQIQPALRIARQIFLPEDDHKPLFIYSQNMPGIPKVNQLAKTATYQVVSPQFWRMVRNNPAHTIKLRRLLNTGIASAITQAIIQNPKPITIQDPVATKSRLCMRSVPAKMRV